MTWFFMRKRGRGFDARNRNPWLPGGCTQAQIAPWDKYIVVFLLQSEESHSIHDTWQGSAAPDTSWSFFPAPSICFIPFSSSALWDLFSSSFFFHFFNIFCPSWPWCHSVFCARGAMMELNTDYGSYLLYPCQDSCQEQWMKMKSAWIKIMGDTIQVKRYHRNIFSFGWVCCGIKFEAPTRLIFSYPESP